MGYLRRAKSIFLAARTRMTDISLSVEGKKRQLTGAPAQLLTQNRKEKHYLNGGEDKGVKPK